MSHPLSRILARAAPLWALIAFAVAAASSTSPVPPGDTMLAEYFKAETARLSERCLSEVKTLEDWQTRRAEYRRQAAEMLGLWPEPARTELRPVITGALETNSVVVENLHFQSMPGLYVTANFYRPKEWSQKLPTILYVCGHGPVISNKVSYGNKVSYQHHGLWFARHGYACLVMDTVQLGEILGLHHGTYREGMWWWNARGYSPAAVEAWNSIRALDYLCSRPEVDPNRLGVTGRSGGGSYSWTLAATDERVKAIAPVAGLTDLHNHVVHGVVEGHCDCMFFVNTYRWDYPQLACLSAPRPLLLVNTDADSIFPLDGVLRAHDHLKRIYQLHRASTNLGLVIAPGPHKDTQDLQIPVFRWFNRHLKGEDPVIETAAVKWFAPQQLKVFKELPAEAVNTNIQSLFVPMVAVPPPPAARAEWETLRDQWLAKLAQQCFAGWPADPGPLNLKQLYVENRGPLTCEAHEFQSQPHVQLRLYVLKTTGIVRARQIIATVPGEKTAGAVSSAGASFTDPRAREVLEAFGLTEWPASLGDTVLVSLETRGVGASRWSGDDKKQRHIRRRFMLLGQTLESMRVWDIRRGLQALRQLPGLADLPLRLEAAGTMGVNAAYACLFEPACAGLTLTEIPASHQVGPDYLNVLKVLDIPQAIALAASRQPVRLVLGSPVPEAWRYPAELARNLRWPKEQFQVTER